MAFLNFLDLKFFKMHPLLKSYNLFYSNGVAILSGFHDTYAAIGTLENMYVQYDCNRTVLFEICSGNVGQSSYAPKGTTRPPRGVVCKI